MCQAIREIEQEFRLLGQEEGLAKGREEGREEGREKERKTAKRTIEYMRGYGIPENEILNFLVGAFDITPDQASTWLTPEM